MIKKPFLIFLIPVLFSGVNFGFSKAKISELLQDSTFHSETPSVKLFMIEFWVLFKLKFGKLKALPQRL
jgi:hypothetical protein